MRKKCCQKPFTKLLKGKLYKSNVHEANENLTKLITNVKPKQNQNKCKTKTKPVQVNIEL